MSINDIIFCSALFCVIPVMVRYFLSTERFTPKFINIVMLGGMLWFTMGVVGNDILLSLLDVGRADDLWHDESGTKVADWMHLGNWDAIAQHAHDGNTRFHLWIGAWYSVASVGKTSLEALNCVIGLWGVLALTRYFGSMYADPMWASDYLLLVALLPSAVFWTSLLLKEALMLWSICIFYTSVMPVENGKKFRFGLLTVVSFAAGILLRPYTMMAWVCAIGIVSVIKSGRIMVAMILVAGLFFSLAFFSSQVGIESLQEAKTFGEGQATIHVNLEDARSTIHGTRILFVSGFEGLFFRPFLWNVRSMRLLVSAAEIWFITLSIAYGWYTLKPSDRRKLLSRPDVEVSILVCGAFCILFSYIVNEGQLARIRLQALPAMITLAYVPFALKRERSWLLSKNRRKIGSGIPNHRIRRV